MQITCMCTCECDGICFMFFLPVTRTSRKEYETGLEINITSIHEDMELISIYLHFLIKARFCIYKTRGPNPRRRPFSIVVIHVKH